MSIKSIGKITDYEKTLIEAALPELATNIEKASSTFPSHALGTDGSFLYRVSRSFPPRSFKSTQRPRKLIKV